LRLEDTMNSMKNPVNNAPVNPAATPETAATPAPEPTFTFTERQLREMMATVAAETLASQPTTPAPAGMSLVAGPRQATNPEACAAHKVLTLLERVTSTAIVNTRDHILVPGNLYLLDEAVPQALAIVATGSTIAASGASKASSYFARLAERAAALARR
jgi:hypothetical protein